MSGLDQGCWGGCGFYGEMAWTQVSPRYAHNVCPQCGFCQRCRSFIHHDEEAAEWAEARETILRETTWKPEDVDRALDMAKKNLRMWPADVVQIARDSTRAALDFERSMEAINRILSAPLPHTGD